MLPNPSSCINKERDRSTTGRERETDYKCQWDIFNFAGRPFSLEERSNFRHLMLQFVYEHEDPMKTLHILSTIELKIAFLSTHL